VLKLVQKTKSQVSLDAQPQAVTPKSITQLNTNAKPPLAAAGGIKKVQIKTLNLTKINENEERKEPQLTRRSASIAGLETVRSTFKDVDLALITSARHLDIK
jgi:hypothetical protein